ncbi:hypothetical protein [Mycobacteroides abscessus]|uniref:hypothetical protein n=1 Tax=Mycobacteroides abscessus TaxID=36809 RepID=UPI00026837B0|nr:hypothetical protein [Mycobacteroides abscessus]EIT89476.1 hypothetical protein MA4S0303_3274 [Mycobacteroides abscessus 4S-0303]EIT95018.1 hypothetical protein MA4S0726RA_3208 [Mycobacteroides abscessus 4S-0726-RA]EIV48228.1 hypothetical protein MA4S0116R_3248 [Mycobacteroides abscessus 4S-0116-R]EIV59451.1 hypothetical protein MA4S0116S_2346 [Mycobacteroides abscessus 4S-0116-S]SIL74300.1 Uncharacterised protein [Mycobacteroides abscessus subsp. abscessus]
MSGDPAARAATRAIARIGNGLANVSLRFASEVGADEALKPIRERHAHWVAELERPPLPATAGAIALAVLADLAPLIYPTKELES